MKDTALQVILFWIESNDLSLVTPKSITHPSIYNLKGQRVRTMQRGQLYIVDGKKYVRK